MDKLYSLIAILALLAVAGFTLFFVNRSRLTEQEDIMDEQMEQLTQELERLTEIQEDLRRQQEESEELARQAREARQMAEAQAEKERMERQKLVDELNARLKREAAERREAEEGQALLESRIRDLEVAQSEAQLALATLEEEEAAGIAPGEAVELKQRIEQQEQQLVALTEENRQLKEQREMLETRQIKTEEAILSAGGKIELPYPEIRSPNIRRREAIYFKERVLGIPEG
ncbi:MAG: hypothetical protein ACP5I4_13785 [Oceanipulchritudo sp.]